MPKGTTMSSLSSAAQLLGRKGGKASGKVWTPEKIAASRKNGKLGGRPPSKKVAA